MNRKVLGCALVVLSFATFAFAIYTLFLRIPMWGFWAIVIPGLVPMAVASKLFRSDKEARDLLKPWRDWRIVKDLSFQWSGESACMLTLQLTQQRSGGPVRVLRFHDVRGMHWGQLWYECLVFDGAGFDLGEGRKDGMRYRIEDRLNETFRFVCSGYEELSVSEPAETAPHPR